MSLPVVFFHRGKHKYLSIAIKRAISSGNEVYLLGNQDNKYFCSNWVDFNSLEVEKVNKFKKLYVHMSTNPFDFELFCILRYFYLYEFMLKNGINRVILVDSDCLIFKKYEVDEYESYDAAFGIFQGYVCPSSCCWTVKSLGNFIDFVLDIYKNELDVLIEKWEMFGKGEIENGGICDMTLLELWINTLPPLKILNLAKNDNILFEYVPSKNAESEKLYRYDKFSKLLKIQFLKGYPYLVRTDGQLQRVYNLHMHGGKKVYMGLLSKGNTNRFLFYFIACYRKMKWAIVKRIYHQK